MPTLVTFNAQTCTPTCASRTKSAGSRAGAAKARATRESTESDHARAPNDLAILELLTSQKAARNQRIDELFRLEL
jgi:hypothetical protein